MKAIPQFTFYKTKYGDELLVDVVELKDIKKYIPNNPVHSLAYYDVTLITEGKGFFRMGDKVSIVREGDIICTRPGQYRQWDTEHIANGYALIFEEEFLLTFFNDTDFLNNISYFNSLGTTSGILTLPADEYRQTLYLFREIKQEIQVYAEKDKHILRAILYQILKYLDRIYRQANPGYGGKAEYMNLHVRKFMRLVNSHFRQQHTVGYYASEMCLTPNHLNELTGLHTGLTAKQVIQEKLFNEAKKLLLYTNASIEEIAGDLHFEDTSYFIRSFRKHTGITPLQFRNNKKP